MTFYPHPAQAHFETWTCYVTANKFFYYINLKFAKLIFKIYKLFALQKDIYILIKNNWI